MNNEKNNTPSKEHFVPKGAMVFFVLMLILFALIWGFFYLIMIARA